MKNFFYCVVLLILSIAIYAQNNVLKEIKDIDSKMSYGTVKYTVLVNTKNVDLSDVYGDLKVVPVTKVDNELVYYSNDKYKKITATFNINDKTTDSVDYYDGKYIVRIDNDNATIINANVSSNNISIGIGAEPSFCYGRGLSKYDGLKYNKETEEIYCYDRNNSKFKIVAKVDPKLQYAATNIKFYYNDKVLGEIENSNPILVDNKYYIYSNSVQKIGPNNKYNILSATFKKPNEKDCIFDLKNNKLDIIDSRIENVAPIRYKADTVANLTLDDIFELTKRDSANFDKIKSNSNEELNNPYGDKKKINN